MKLIRITLALLILKAARFLIWCGGLIITAEEERQATHVVGKIVGNGKPQIEKLSDV